MKVRHLLVLALMLFAAMFVGACGGDEKSNEPPQELEDTLGFGSGDGAKEVQSPGREPDPRLHEGTGLRLHPRRPVRPAAGA